MKSKKFVNELIESDEYSTKINLFFSTKIAGEDFDPYEKNYTYDNLNPLTVKGYVRDITPEALVWKSYGLQEAGAKEIICRAKYEEWFKLANKIIIDGDTYELYKEGTGGKALITKRPFRLIRVVLFKKDKV